MRHRLFAVLLLALVSLTGAVSFAQSTLPEAPASKLTESEFIEKVYYPAVVLLYSQDDSGDMHMRCTATAVERHIDTYTFVTASHCASQDDAATHRSTAEKTSFFITPDETRHKDFLEAKVEACGYQSRGDDFCIFTVKTTHIFPVVPIGEDSTAIVGEDIVNIASPEGLGKQVFYGRVTMPRLDRPVIVEDSSINWTGTVLLQLPGTNGGSSGSSIVCVKQRAVCGFLVGRIAGTTTVAMPVSRFRNFETLERAGNYKYYDNDPDDPDVPILHIPFGHGIGKK